MVVTSHPGTAPPERTPTGTASRGDGVRTICLATPVEDPERFARAQAHFAEVGLTDVSYCYGLHKSQSGLDSKWFYMVDRFAGVDAEGYLEFDPYNMGPHPTNIWLGHYMIWNALRLSGDKEWFVIECDAKFPPNWQPYFDQAMVLAGTLPAYDLVYIGSCCTTGRAKTTLIHPSHNAGHGIYDCGDNAPQCNHAYVVTAAAAEIMCTRMRKVWAPVDVQQTTECFGHPLRNAIRPGGPLARKLVVYTVLPRIVDQWNTEIPE